MTSPMISLTEAMKKVYGAPLPEWGESDREYASKMRSYYAETWTLDEQHEFALQEEVDRNRPASTEDLSASGCACPHCTGSHL